MALYINEHSTKLHLFRYCKSSIHNDQSLTKISASKLLPKNMKCLSKVAPTKMAAVEQKWHCTERHGEETQAETQIETTSRNTKCIQKVFLANFSPNFMLSSLPSHIHCPAAKLLQGSGAVLQFWYYLGKDLIWIRSTLEMDHCTSFLLAKKKKSLQNNVLDLLEERLKSMSKFLLITNS